jgi:WD40 repeat protein
MVFSPDGTILALASSDGTVKLSDSTDGTYIQVLHEFNNPRSMVFSPDGMILATVSNTVCLWDITSATLKQTLGGETVEEWPIKYFAFLPNGKCTMIRVYRQALSSESEIDLFDIATGSRKPSPALLVTSTQSLQERGLLLHVCIRHQGAQGASYNYGMLPASEKTT